MPDLSAGIGTPAAGSLTCTTTSLGDGGFRSSAARDNSTDDVWDDLVRVQVKSTTSAGSSGGYVNVWISACVDGTNYPGEVSGSDEDVAAIGTITAAEQIANCDGPYPIIVIADETTARDFEISFSIRDKLGFMPVKYVIIIQNETDVDLGATDIDYTPVNPASA